MYECDAKNAAFPKLWEAPQIWLQTQILGSNVQFHYI